MKTNFIRRFFTILSIMGFFYCNGTIAQTTSGPTSCNMSAVLDISAAFTSNNGTNTAVTVTGTAYQPVYTITKGSTFNNVFAVLSSPLYSADATGCQSIKFNLSGTAVPTGGSLSIVATTTIGSIIYRATQGQNCIRLCNLALTTEPLKIGLNFNVTTADQNNTIIISNFSRGTGVVPIKLTKFEAAPNKKDVQLSWSVASGSDAATFEIERSIDGRNFTTITTVTAAGFDYQYTDRPGISKVVYYRLKSTSTAGRSEYSKIIPVNLALNSSIFIYPTLVTGSVLNVDATEKTNVKVINAVGRTMITKSIFKGLSQIDVSGFQKGVYYLQDALTGEMKKFVVTK